MDHVNVKIMVGAETVFGEMELVHDGKWIGDNEEARSEKCV